MWTSAFGPTKKEENVWSFSRGFVVSAILFDMLRETIFFSFNVGVTRGDV